MSYTILESKACCFGNASDAPAKDSTKPQPFLTFESITLDSTGTLE